MKSPLKQLPTHCILPSKPLVYLDSGLINIQSYYTLRLSHSCSSLNTLLDGPGDLPGVYEAESRGNRQSRDQQPEPYEQQDREPEEVQHAIA